MLTVDIKQQHTTTTHTDTYIGGTRTMFMGLARLVEVTDNAGGVVKVVSSNLAWVKICSAFAGILNILYLSISTSFTNPYSDPM